MCCIPSDKINLHQATLAFAFELDEFWKLKFAFVNSFITSLISSVPWQRPSRAVSHQQHKSLTINRLLLTLWAMIENREEIDDYSRCVEDWQKSQPWLQLLGLQNYQTRFQHLNISLLTRSSATAEIARAAVVMPFKVIRGH